MQKFCSNFCVNFLIFFWISETYSSLPRKDVHLRLIDFKFSFWRLISTLCISSDFDMRQKGMKTFCDWFQRLHIFNCFWICLIISIMHRFIKKSQVSSDENWWKLAGLYKSRLSPNSIIWILVTVCLVPQCWSENMLSVCPLIALCYKMRLQSNRCEDERAICFLYQTPS